MWLSVFCTLIDSDTRRHSAPLALAHNILTTVITRIVVDKSSDHAKPHFDLFLTTISKSKKMVFTERELKKALPDTLTRAALSGL